MATSSIRVRRISARLTELDEDERLIAESEMACACFDLSELMSDVSRTFDDLVRLDEHYRFDDAAESVIPQIEKLFARWNDIARRLIHLYSVMREEYFTRGFNVDVFAGLMDRFRQCDAALSPSEEDSSLADEAIAEHRSGRTVPM